MRKNKVSNFEEDLAKECERIKVKEQILGKTLMQPFTANNSGSRNIMYCIHVEHALPLLTPEIPYIQTGYENRFGDYSSSIIKSDSDYEVVDKIVKFQEKPNHHYYLLMRNKRDNTLHVIKRVSYKHITESYGYLYNNNTLDSLDIGYEVNEDEILRKSEAFDEYGNRCDGVNLMAMYVAREKLMEDGIIISKSAQKKLGSPLLKKVTVIVNDNDIPLNIHGDNNYFKAFPEIGEYVDDGILCCLRRDNNDEALFTQSWDNLKRIMTSDEKIPVNGRVIDINIYSNSPEILKERSSYEQLLKYYNEKRRFLYEFVEGVNSAMQQYNCTGMSEELQKTYERFLAELDEKKYMRENKIFSGTLMEFIIQENNYPHTGDKLSNRFGGKGVIAQILPDEEMPMTDSGKRAEILYNQSTCINRLNHGQMNEISLSMICQRMVQFIKTGVTDVNESLEMILRLLSIVSPSQFQETANMLNWMEDEEKEFFLESILEDEIIYLSFKPLTETVTLDMLDRVYKEFPWLTQYTIYTPMRDSCGEIRYVECMRKANCGYMFIYRLKQYAEEKFSVTNLSATNLKNENTKSKDSKNYRALHQNTPIRFGDMESGDFSHLGMETFIKILLIYSLSPQARENMEKLWTDDPYEIDIELGPNCRNRSVEILNAYFKTIGLRIVFEKHEKETHYPITFNPVMFKDKCSMDKMYEVFKIMDPNIKIDPVKNFEKSTELIEKFNKSPIRFYPMVFFDDKTDKWWDNEEQQSLD